MASLKDVICTGVIRCLSNVYASKFIGNLQGTADKAKTLDGMTASVTELNCSKGVTSGIQTQINDLKKSVSDGKTLVANAITGKGIETAADATFVTIADNISKIETGVDTSDGTATSDMILSGQTAYVNGEKVVGTLGKRVTDCKISSSKTITSLGTAREHLGSASVGNYAVFAGGDIRDRDTTVSSVDAYNTSLTKTTPTSLSKAGRGVGASVGNYAVFGSYVYSSSSSMDAYSTSLVKTTLSSNEDFLNNTAYWIPDGVSVGNYAVFAGSAFGSGARTVAYNASLVKTYPSSLSKKRELHGSASVGNYAVFAGGFTGDGDYQTSSVEVYNSSLVKSTAPDLSVARVYIAGASVGDYALFGGGYTQDGSKWSTVDIYNSSLVRTTTITLTESKETVTGTSFGNICALFAGGAGNSGRSTTIDAYNSVLVRQTSSLPNGTTSGMKGAKVGNYELFGGGSTQSGITSNMYAYTMDTYSSIVVPETVIKI